VVACEALPGGVVTFQCPVPNIIQTPLECKAGEYAKIMIPVMQVREWHPFSLSGDPKAETLQFHIKALGDWTRRLYELAASGKLMSQRVIVQASFTTRAREYKNFDVVMFVATGIGNHNVLIGIGRPTWVTRTHGREVLSSEAVGLIRCLHVGEPSTES
jgi:predicted ferric reductase